MPGELLMTPCAQALGGPVTPHDANDIGFSWVLDYLVGTIIWGLKIEENVLHHAVKRHETGSSTAKAGSTQVARCHGKHVGMGGI